MKVIKYEGHGDQWKKTVVDEPDDDTPQKRRCNAMAEAQPGRVVVGWQARSSEVDVEEEAYLDEL